MTPRQLYALCAGLAGFAMIVMAVILVAFNVSIIRSWQ